MVLPEPRAGDRPGVATRGLLADIGVACSARHAMRESGDVVRIVDTPEGGVCAILVDGQGHGRAARLVAMAVTAQVASLVARGVRDEIAMGAANDALHADRGGRVSCEAWTLAVDPADGVVRVTRFAKGGPVVVDPAATVTFANEGMPLGLRRGAEPVVDTISVGRSTACLVASDGVRQAGSRGAVGFRLQESLMAHRALGGNAAAHAVLKAAIAADDGRPRDDMSVAVLTFELAAAGSTIWHVGGRWPM